MAQSRTQGLGGAGGQGRGRSGQGGAGAERASDDSGAWPRVALFLSGGGVSRRRPRAGAGPRPSTHAVQDAAAARPARAAQRALTCGAPTRHHPSPLGDSSRATVTRDPPGSGTGSEAPHPGRPKRGVNIRSRDPCRPTIGMMRTARHLGFDGTRPQSSRRVTCKQPPEVERSVLWRCFCVTARPLRPASAHGARANVAPRVPRRRTRKPHAPEKDPAGTPADPPPTGRTRPADALPGRPGSRSTPFLKWDDDVTGNLSGVRRRGGGATRRASPRPAAGSPRRTGAPPSPVRPPGSGTTGPAHVFGHHGATGAHTGHSDTTRASPTSRAPRPTAATRQRERFGPDRGDPPVTRLPSGGPEDLTGHIRHRTNGRPHRRAKTAEQGAGRRPPRGAQAACPGRSPCAGRRSGRALSRNARRAFRDQVVAGPGGGRTEWWPCSDPEPVAAKRRALRAAQPRYRTAAEPGRHTATEPPPPQPPNRKC